MCMSDPKSLKAICRMTGTSLDGHTREALSGFLDVALLNLWEAAVNAHGAPHAACIMWRLTSRDTSFALPHWLTCVYKRHRAAILEDLHERGVAL